MAGRGCTIVVKLLGGSSGNDENEDISLPVALHSPLQVLKEQLATLVGIATADQVLILCNLDDPERNSDKLLSGSEFMSLRDIGIRNGAVLTLHALGMPAERKQLMAKEAFSVKAPSVPVNTEKINTLETSITSAEANHSYNGIIFDVSSDGPHEVDVISVSLAGMLGRVRVFARDRPWEANKPPASQSPNWWAHRESLSREGWQLVADVMCRPAWDKPVEIKFLTKVRLLPHERRALYCHSGLPDDLGIQYQSYPSNSVFASDQFISLHAGLGHTGSHPFDDVNGWYRGGRGLAGSIRYHKRMKGWSPFEHRIFPAPLKDAVKTVLLCQRKESNDVTNAHDGLSHSEGEDWGHSSNGSYSNNSGNTKCQATASSFSTSGRYFTRSRSSSHSSANSISHKRRHIADSPVCAGTDAGAGTGGLSSPLRAFKSDRLVTRSATSASLLRGGDGVPRLHRLPVHVIYNILEYMHWDWFEECDDAYSFFGEDEEDEEDGEGNLSAGRGRRQGSKALTSKKAASTASSHQNYIQHYLLNILSGAIGPNALADLQAGGGLDLEELMAAYEFEEEEDEDYGEAESSNGTDYSEEEDEWEDYEEEEESGEEGGAVDETLQQEDEESAEGDEAMSAAGVEEEEEDSEMNVSFMQDSDDDRHE